MKRILPIIGSSFLLGLGLAYYWLGDLSNLIYIFFFLGGIFLLNRLFLREDLLGLASVFTFLGMVYMCFILKNNYILENLGKRPDLTIEIVELRELEDLQIGLGRLRDPRTSSNLEFTYRGGRRLKLGQELLIKNTEIKELETRRNPFLYDKRAHSFSKRVFGKIRLEDRNILELREGISTRLSLRSNFKTYVDRAFQPIGNPLIGSIILGDTGYMEEDQLELYRGLGLSHILAASGLHLGILATFILGIFYILGLNRSLAYVLGLVLVWIYGFLIGFPPSILRGAIMYTVYVGSQVFYQAYDSKNSLFLALFLLLVENPFYILSLGFRLSFIACLGLIYIWPKLREIFRSDLFIVRASLPLIAISLGLFPLQIYYFNILSPIGLISNLLLVPIISLGLILGFGLLVAFVLPGPVYACLVLALNLVLELVDIMTLGVEALDLLSWTIRSPSPAEILIYYLVLYLVLNFRNFNTRQKKLLEVYLLGLVVTSLIFSLEDRPSLEIDFIDVGQGDSILIRSRENILIDTGGDPLNLLKIPERITYPYLVKTGIKKLDGLVISHFHEDHCGGLNMICSNLPVKRVYTGYEPEARSDYERLLESKQELELVTKGDRLGFREGDLEVLSPRADYSLRRLGDNNMSLVLLLRHRGWSVLFTGDIEAPIERLLEVDGPIDLIKIPHHGSKTSSTRDFLSRLGPRIGVVSLARNNIFSHPSEELLENCRDLNIDLFRTDESGLIRASFYRDKLKITSYLPDKKLDGLYLLIYLMILCLIYYVIVAYIVTEDGGLNGF